MGLCSKFTSICTNIQVFIFVYLDITLYIKSYKKKEKWV